MAKEGSSVFGSTKALRSAFAGAYLATGHGYRASGERRSATEQVLVLRGGRATEPEAGSVAGSCGDSGGILGLHDGGARDEVGPS